MSVSRVRKIFARITSVLAAVVVVSAGFTAVSAVTTTESASAADLSQFRPGNIIADELFWDSNSMTAAEVQTFLNSKVDTCAATNGYPCLKDYRETTWTSEANPMCSAYQGAANETAAQIIDKVARACGVSQKAILVILQKEQGLVTDRNPDAWSYRAAMGAGCPDTAACDSTYRGFYNQVRYGAYLLKRYTQPPGTGPGTWWDSRFDLMYPVGRVSSILYNPDRACGTQDVYIENQATHALYVYTPYTPNAAALAAGYGLGDGCSAYGNRNFFNYYTDWFGSTQAMKVPWPTAYPTVPTNARVGVAMTAWDGTYLASPSPTYTYQWMRCTQSKSAAMPDLATLPSGCTAITGATAKAFTPTQDERGTYLSVRVRATNAAGTYGSWSVTSGMVTQTPTVTTAPALSGSLEIGGSATAAPGVWAALPSPTMTYAWYACPASVPSSGPSRLSDCTALTSTTTSIAWPVTATGKFGAVRVTATNSAGTSSVWATTPTTVVAPTPTPTPTPTATPTATPTPTPSTTPSPTATPTPSVTPSATPTPTPTPTAVLPSLTGTAKVGQLLVASPGSWRGAYQNYGSSYNGYFVRNIQLALIGSSIPISRSNLGVYTSATRNGVSQFQKDKSITADARGVVGPTTWAAMVPVIESPAAVLYTWYSCTSPVPAATSTIPSSCSALSPTSSSYRLVGTNIGRFVTVAVTGSSAGVVRTLLLPSTVAVAP